MPAKGTVAAKETPRTLSTRLHVSTTSLYAWAKLPGAPTIWSEEPWRKFIEENGLGISGNRVNSKREGHLVSKLEKENLLLDLKIAKERGQMVDKAQVNEFMLHVSTLMKTTLRQRLGRELGARAEGKSAAELNALGEQITDELCHLFAEGLEQFKNS